MKRGRKNDKILRKMRLPAGSASAAIWPSDITLPGDTARITMDGHPENIKPEDGVILVDLGDFSFRLPDSEE